MNELNWTGERLVTSVNDIHGVIEHLHRYALAMEVCKNKVVLDIASGEGYGSNLISSVAQYVYGVDISNEAIEHAKSKYSSSNIKFLQGNTSNIPLEDNSVDVIISFETIEHHCEHEEMLMEFKRVLKLGGVCLISSPEKSIYSLRDPENIYHKKELTLSEFTSLVQRHFNFLKIFDQSFVFGSLIKNISDRETNNLSFYNGNYNKIDKGLNMEQDFYNLPFFNLILASDQKVDSYLSDLSFFDGVNILHQQNVNYLNQLNNLKSSVSYRVGNFLIRPFSFLKRKFKIK